MNTKFKKALDKFDALNSQDPNQELWGDSMYPKELLYAQRMSETLLDFNPNSNNTVQIAARCQHICRWEIPRNTYEINRSGYLRWRKALANYHVAKASEVLKSLDFDDKTISDVSQLLLKNKLKTNPDVQLLEDVICLVFLKYYFEVFSKKYDETKIIEILQKTWSKMSQSGQEAALRIEHSESSKSLLLKALKN
jgi:predicted transcriptional regulator